MSVADDHTEGRVPMTHQEIRVAVERHMAAVVLTYEMPKQVTSPGRGPHTYAFASFVVESGGQWYLVTAGHCIAEFEQYRATGEYVAIGRSLCDFVSRSAAHRSPIPFDQLGDAPTDCVVVDEAETTGLDVAVFSLSPIHRRLLEANGISPIPTWDPDGESFTVFSDVVVVGFPEERRTPRATPVTPLAGLAMRSVSQRVEIVNPPLDDKRFPRMRGYIGDISPLTTFRGMSGGPVVGVRAASNECIALGIQSTWLEEAQEIRVCPIRAALSAALGRANTTGAIREAEA